MSKLLVIENDLKLESDRHHDVLKFLRDWKGDVEMFTGFRTKTPEQVYKAVSECTDIVCQTALANGSQFQLGDMTKLLGKIKESKNIYLEIFSEDLNEFFNSDFFTDEEMSDIYHHNIFHLDPPHEKIDFSERVIAYRDKLAKEKEYRDTAQSRPTGVKVKVLACNASGKPFENLPIGQIVDELDMSAQDDSARGTWIWGNGEPIKLVNDCGLKEYEIVSVTSYEDLIDAIEKGTAFKLSRMSDLEIIGLKTVIEENSDNVDGLSNYLCAQNKIPRRGNRAIIRELLTKYFNQKQLA